MTTQFISFLFRCQMAIVGYMMEGRLPPPTLLPSEEPTYLLFGPKIYLSNGGRIT